MCSAAKWATIHRRYPGCDEPRPGDEGGRGLFLVDRLAQRWGATRLSTGKVVWFEQPIPEEYRPNGRDAP